MTDGKTYRAIGALMRCDICMEQLDDPRLLTCGHTFCARCLQLQLTRSGPQLRLPRLACAYCRKPTRLTLRGVSDLPTNRLAHSIRQLLAADSASSVDSRFDDTSSYDSPLPNLELASLSSEGAVAQAHSGSGMYATISSWLTCEVCSRQSDDLRVLTCGHMYCMQCIEQRLLAASFNKTQVFCTQCRKRVKLLQAGGSLADLPRNFIADNVRHVLAGDGHLVERRPLRQFSSPSQPEASLAEAAAPAGASASRDVDAARVAAVSEMTVVTVQKVVSVRVSCACCGAEVKLPTAAQRFRTCGHRCCVRCQGSRVVCRVCERTKAKRTVTGDDVL